MIGQNTTQTSTAQVFGVTAEVQEQYRTLLRQLNWPTDNDPPMSLGVTSCRATEGVSTVVWQLAATAASTPENRVLLVDFNFTAPAVHTQFNLPASPGLADVLEEKHALAEAIKPTSAAGLFVLPAGNPTGELSAIYDSPQLAEKLEQLSAGFDLILFDLPPFGESSAATRIVGLLSGVLLVVQAHRTSTSEIRRTQDMLTRADANLVGAVLNRAYQPPRKPR